MDKQIEEDNLRQGLKKLYADMLMQEVADFKKYHKATKRYLEGTKKYDKAKSKLEETLDWFSTDSEDLFGITRLCDALELNITYIRKKVEQYNNGEIKSLDYEPLKK